jgi:hypothetical protein
MKFHHLTEVLKSWKCELSLDHVGRAWDSRLDKSLIFLDRRGATDHVWPNAVENISTGSRLCRSNGQYRYWRWFTFAACIAADGFRIKPFAIVSRFTAEKELRCSRYDESNVVLTSQSNAFMTRAVFKLWDKRVFFSAIDQRHRNLGYHGKTRLLMHGLGFHPTAKFLAECTAPSSEVSFLIAHASDQLQPLDLLTFATMK